MRCPRVPGSDEPVAKKSYARHFAPWDWYLVTGMYMDDVQHAFIGNALRWLAITAVLGMVATLVMVLVLRSVQRNLGGDLEVAVATAIRISGGDLTMDVPMRRGDDFSLMHATYAKNKYRSLFVGMAPMSDPRVIVAVMIDEPSGRAFYGGTVAGPVFSSVAGGALQWLGVPPDA